MADNENAEVDEANKNAAEKSAIPPKKVMPALIDKDKFPSSLSKHTSGALTVRYY